MTKYGILPPSTYAIVEPQCNPLHGYVLGKASVGVLYSTNLLGTLYQKGQKIF